MSIPEHLRSLSRRHTIYDGSSPTKDDPCTSGSEPHSSSSSSSSSSSEVALPPGGRTTVRQAEASGWVVILRDYPAGGKGIATVPFDRLGPMMDAERLELLDVARRLAEEVRVLHVPEQDHLARRLLEEVAPILGADDAD